MSKAYHTTKKTSPSSKILVRKKEHSYRNTKESETKRYPKRSTIQDGIGRIDGEDCFVYQHRHDDSHPLAFEDRVDNLMGMLKRSDHFQIRLKGGETNGSFGSLPETISHIFSIDDFHPFDTIGRVSGSTEASSRLLHNNFQLSRLELMERIAFATKIDDFVFCLAKEIELKCGSATISDTEKKIICIFGEFVGMYPSIANDMYNRVTRPSPLNERPLTEVLRCEKKIFDWTRYDSIAAEFGNAFCIRPYCGMGASTMSGSPASSRKQLSYNNIIDRDGFCAIARREDMMKDLLISVCEKVLEKETVSIPKKCYDGGAEGKYRSDLKSGLPMLCVRTRYEETRGIVLTEISPPYNIFDGKQKNVLIAPMVRYLLGKRYVESDFRRLIKSRDGLVIDYRTKRSELYPSLYSFSTSSSSSSSLADEETPSVITMSFGDYALRSIRPTDFAVIPDCDAKHLKYRPEYACSRPRKSEDHLPGCPCERKIDTKRFVRISSKMNNKNPCTCPSSGRLRDCNGMDKKYCDQCCRFWTLCLNVTYYRLDANIKNHYKSCIHGSNCNDRRFRHLAHYSHC